MRNWLTAGVTSLIFLASAPSPANAQTKTGFVDTDPPIDPNKPYLEIGCSGTSVDIIHYDYEQKNIASPLSGRKYNTNDFMYLAVYDNGINFTWDTMPLNDSSRFPIKKNISFSRMTNKKLEEPLLVIMNEAIKVCSTEKQKTNPEAWPLKTQDVPADQKSAFDKLRVLMKHEPLIQ